MSEYDIDWEMKCPECGEDDALDVAATVWVRLCIDGTDADQSQDASKEWDDESNCCCTCGWNGKVKDAKEAYKKV